MYDFSQLFRNVNKYFKNESFKITLNGKLSTANTTVIKLALFQSEKLLYLVRL